MGDSEHFRRQFTCIMENILHSAVVETTKLFERTVQDVKAELVWIKKQNDKVKDSLCSDQRLVSKCKGDQCKRDIGVQCDVTSTLVEQSCSPHSQHEDANKTQTETGFSDPFPGFLQDGNQQFTLLFIKPEEPDLCDYTTACLLPKLAEDEPTRCLVQHMSQEAGLLPVKPSPYQGLSDTHSTVLFTHSPTASPQSVQEPATSAPARTPQSQEFCPVDGLRASLDLMPDAQKDENMSASINDVGKLSYQDQPRRLSARKSKSIYRRLIDLEIPQHDAENIQQENENGAKIQRKMGKMTDKQLGRNQSVKNQPLKSESEGNHRHRCEVCDLVLSSASSLKHHWKVHIAEKDSVCYRCGKIFPHERSLKSHQCLEAETKQADFKIEQHQKTHQDQPRLSARRSKSIYRRLVDRETTQSEAENIQQVDDTKASICHVPTNIRRETSKERSNKSLEQPSRNQSDKNHSLKSQPGSNHSQKNQCEVSEQVLKSPSSLEPHSLETPFVCVRCGKAFPDARALRCHFLVHTKDKRNQCLKGDATVKTKLADSEQSLGSLQKTYQGQPRRLGTRKSTSVYRSLVNLETPQLRLTHHQLSHTKERPFHCNLCGKRFASQVSQANHLLTHKRGKPHICTLCSRAFPYRGQLKVHMRRHKGEKPYRCLTCGKQFVESYALKTHERVHTGEKPYQCKICGLWFRQSGHLQYHAKRKHH